ncbi:unnamed protein product [Clonostachys solani]|uniref:Uncharacterized protein n=1 Tax=Clonostachys solani TaxID=160281 RepID=A0A9P0EP14_9HYPO|nr:unnamed protein product [Clonostachys solani]
MSDNGREPQAHRQQQQSPQPIAHGGHGSYHDDPDAASPEVEAPRFEPIFTLLTNSSTNETIHPRVRYLFADDDPSSIIAHEADHDADSSSSPGAHRTLVVDLAPRDSSSSTTTTTPNNWSVSWAASLSPDFAITDSHLLPMQQGGDHHHPDTTTNATSPAAAHNASPPNGGLMLRIDGVEREPVDMRGGPSASSSNSLPGSSGSAAGREDVEALVDDFRRRMGVLRKVVGEGERRREAVRAEQERQEQQEHQHPEGNTGSEPRPGMDADAEEGVEEHDHMKDSG